MPKDGVNINFDFVQLISTLCMIFKAILGSTQTAKSLWNLEKTS